MTDATRFELRAREAVAAVFVRRLMVPTIYFEPRWPDGQHWADVVAIDRAGSGDHHVIEIKQEAAAEHIVRALAWPAPYRWFAYSADHTDSRATERLVEGSYAPDGAGRVGIMRVSRTDLGSLKAQIVVKAERFPGSFVSVAAELARLNKPDIEPDNPDLNAPELNDADRPTEGDINARVAEVGMLLAMRLWVPAFVTAWIAVEGAMRLAAERAGVATDLTSPRALARSLHANGLLDGNELHTLMASFERRNRVVHGMGGGTTDSSEIEAMLRIVHGLTKGSAATLAPA